MTNLLFLNLHGKDMVKLIIFPGIMAAGRLNMVGNCNLFYLFGINVQRTSALYYIRGLREIRFQHLSVYVTLLVNTFFYKNQVK